MQRLWFQIFRDRRELFQRRFEVGGDVGGYDFGCGKVGGFFECVVLQPENVEVHLVTLRQFLVGSCAGSLGGGIFAIAGRCGSGCLGCFVGGPTPKSFLKKLMLRTPR